MTEAEWNAAICGWFFTPAMAGRPVYLWLDEDVLGDIALSQGWHLQDPVADFESAIRSQVIAPTDPLRRWEHRGRQWRKLSAGDRPCPPFVAFLAATVLAATRDTNRGGRGANSYYRPLRRILGLKENGQPAMPPRYDEVVPVLWSHLGRWLDNHGGARGLPTAYAPKSHWQNIGFSMSQAVLRAGDRARLTDFFIAMGATPGAEIDPGEALARFRRWSKGSGRISPRLAAMIQDDGLGDVVGNIISNELRAWDGALRDERGRRIVRLLLRIDERVRELSIVAQVPRGIDEEAVDLLGRQLRLGPEPGHAMTSLTAREIPLDRDFRANLERIMIRYDFRPVVPFRPSEDVGGWVAVDQGELGESHYILVHDSHRQVVEAFLTSQAAAPPTVARRIPLPPGWTLFKAVTLTTTYANVPPALLPLLPRGNRLPELAHGLCVDPRRGLYLDDGPPDVIVPGTETTLPVRLDGQHLTDVGSTGAVISLDALHLPCGRHEVIVGSTRLSFELCHRLAEYPARPMMAHHLYKVTDGFGADGPARKVDPTADVRLAGAAIFSEGDEWVQMPDAADIMIKAAPRGYLAFGPPGSSAELLVQEPDWLKPVGLTFNSFELRPLQDKLTFPVIWAARLFQGRADIIPIADHEAPAPPDLIEMTAWRKHLIDLLRLPRLDVPESARPRWERYCALLGDVDV